MNLTEWNARLHGLVIFRALLDDDVIAKFVDLTDRMAAAPQNTGVVCDAAASFEAALFEHTTNFGEYLSAAVLEAETVCVRQAAVSKVPPVLQKALDGELDFLQQLCGLTLDEPAADLALCIAVASSLKDEPVGQQVAVMGEVGLGGEIRAIPQVDRRVSECVRLGFRHIMCPADSVKRLHLPEGVELTPVKTLAQAITLLGLRR